MHGAPWAAEQGAAGRGEEQLPEDTHLSYLRQSVHKHHYWEDVLFIEKTRLQQTHIHTQTTVSHTDILLIAAPLLTDITVVDVMMQDVNYSLQVERTYPFNNTSR